MSITIDISDELVAEIGQEKIKKEIADTIKLLSMRQRRSKGQKLFTDDELKELLDGLDAIDLSNDPEYQKVRERAWASYTQIHDLGPDGGRKH